MTDEEKVVKIADRKDYRRCISCRKYAPRSEFWRVVKCHPTKQITIDLGTMLMQGRSAYLCPTTECLQLAQKKNRLSRSLKAAVAEDIYHQLGLLKSAQT
jgi:uncharacterized protein